MRRKRVVEGISLSFLDVISCGFGAILLMLVLVRAFSPSISTPLSDLDDIEMKLTKLLEENQTLEKNLIRLEQIKKNQELESIRITKNLKNAKQRELKISQEISLIDQQRQEVLKQEIDIKQKIETLQAGKNSVSDTVAGIKIDSEYIIFIIDTSGSMRSDWLNVLSKVEQILLSYPTLKGIQIMDADGDLLFPYQGLVWNKANLQNRQEILSALARWPEQSLSNPEKGIKKAITNFHSPDKKIAIWIFADDYQGERTVDSLIKFVDNINAVTRDGKRLVTINAIGFRTGFESSRMRFALAMRELCERNGGAFIGL